MRIISVLQLMTYNFGHLGCIRNLSHQSCVTNTHDAQASLGVLQQVHSLWQLHIDLYPSMIYDYHPLFLALTMLSGSLRRLTVKASKPHIARTFICCHSYSFYALCLICQAISCSICFQKTLYRLSRSAVNVKLSHPQSSIDKTSDLWFFL